MQNVYVQNWMALSKNIRDVLIEKLGLKRTGITEVRDQTVVSDGFTNDDLLAITKEVLQEYVGVDDTFARLWELAILKAEGKYEKPKVKPEPEVEVVKTVEPEKVVIPPCEICKGEKGKHLKGCPNK